MEYVQWGCFIIVVIVGIWYIIDTTIFTIKYIINFFKNESEQRTKVSRRRSKRT